MFKEIPLNQIKPGRYQPRQEFDPEKLFDLASSIQEEGLLYPLLVFLDEDNRYELIGGERRWRAVCAVKLANIGEFDGGLADAVAITAGPDWPELIRNGHYQHFASYTIAANEQPPDITDVQQRVRAVADNLQREDLTPFEEAQAIYALKTELKLSIRAVAAKVGKSKSWVSDRLGLLKLDDAAAQAAAAAQADDSAASLDMTVLREVSRKLPEPLQKPVIDVLLSLASKSTTDDLKKLVAALGRMANPDSWAVESAFDDPAHPAVYNRGRAMIAILNSLTPQQLVKRLMKLHAKESYNNYLAKKPGNVLNNDWDFKRIARTLLDLSDVQNVWETIAPERGWTCANCLKEPLAGSIENRVRDFERRYETPCARLGIDAEAQTCEQFVQRTPPADVPIITIPSTLAWCFEDDSHEAKMMKPLAGHNCSYVESWLDYHHLYTAARQAREAKEARIIELAKTAHLEPLREYWQQQVDGQLDLYDFQAHACHKCVNFDKARIEQHATPCRFAAEPLGKEDAPRPPEMGVLVDDQGRAVPRCSKFRYTEEDMPALSASPAQFQAGDEARDILLAWYKHITRKAERYNCVYGVLAWLPSGAPTTATLPKLWDQYTEPEVLALLHIGVFEALASVHRFNSGPRHMLAPNGQGASWQALDWEGYIDQRSATTGATGPNPGTSAPRTPNPNFRRLRSG